MGNCSPCGSRAGLEGAGWFPAHCAMGAVDAEALWMWMVAWYPVGVSLDLH